MDKKISRVIALLLVTAMFLITFAGCKKGMDAVDDHSESQISTENPEVTEDNQTVTDTTEDSTSEATENTDPSDEPTKPSKPEEQKPANKPTKPTEPKPTKPQPTDPKPTEPKPTEPKPTEPKPIEPKPTEPEHKNPIEGKSAKDVLLMLSESFRNVHSYKSNIVGEVKTEIKILDSVSLMVQEINDIHIKCGSEAYLKAKSTSDLVGVGKEAFFSGSSVVMRTAKNVKKDEWPDKCSVVSLTDYCKTEGNTPFKLSNYLISKDTILEASMKKNSDGTYTITAKIDPEKGTERYAARMKEYGGLSKLPQFTECKIEIRFNEDLTIKYLKSYDTYTANLLGNHACTSQLTETFDYSKGISIPNADVFRGYLK